MDDALCIGLATKPMASGDQCVAKGAEVVYLSIEDSPHGFRFVGDGLRSRDEVNDLEPPDAKADARSNKRAPLIRPAMGNGFAHGGQLGLHYGSAGGPRNASYAAHVDACFWS